MTNTKVDFKKEIVSYLLLILGSAMFAVADVMFNSALLYELGILRPFAEPLLKMVPQNSEEYAESTRLLSVLELIEPIQTRFIPPTSILREFLGESSFEY